MKKLTLVAITLLALNSCSITTNSGTKNFGGSQEVQLEPNERFINITWKESNLWLVTQDTTTKDYIFRERSQFGIWEGKVIIKSAQ